MSTLTIHCDGSCYHKDKRMGMGVVFFNGDSETPLLHNMITTHGKKGTNNEAEYLAIISALKTITRHKFDTKYDRIIINSDSELVINQINGMYEVRNPQLVIHLKKVTILLSMMKITIVFNWVPRENSRQMIADKYSKEANEYFNQK